MLPQFTLYWRLSAKIVDQPNRVVMRSRVALALLQRAAQQGVRFSVIVTEGRPDDTGLSMARALDELHIPVTLVLDSGAAYCLERCAHGRTACRRGTPH